MIFIRRICIFLFLLFVSNPFFSQEKEISGYITIFNKIPVVSAEVKVLSTKKTVLTDTLGYFKVTCNNEDRIKISARGFVSQKIKVFSNTDKFSVNLEFKPSKKNIDVAVGFGHIKESDKTLAITSIRDDGKLKFEKYSNMIDLIIDSSPSITVLNGVIVIRGESSLNGSSGALVLVNGNQITMTQLSALDPLSVKSVDILKGSSAAMYGTRGANGVILITTK